MKRLSAFCFICMLLTGFVSCTKWNEYTSFVPNGETRYPGIDSLMKYSPGNMRGLVWWSPTPDQTVKKYIVYWNDKQDSLIVSLPSTNPHDTIRAAINELPEGSYSFTVYALDAHGNRSVPRMISNARSYGAIYNNTLYNRSLNVENPSEFLDASTVKLNFNEPDTININTEIRYLDLHDVWQTTHILPTVSSVILNDFKSATKIAFRSSFIPVKGAIDTFYTNRYDSVEIK
jgi:hypothetical protein